jgi:hypothetical protein
MGVRKKAGERRAERREIYGARTDLVKIIEVFSNS